MYLDHLQTGYAAELMFKKIMNSLIYINISFLFPEVCWPVAIAAVWAAKQSKASKQSNANQASNASKAKQHGKAKQSKQGKQSSKAKQMTQNACRQYLARSLSIYT